ncbi:MAG: hypothetical protein HKP58_08650 [Desulfatitalea sp.]|nr:hypothetical protein [Desulfatitalea sp.]NNK00467.1 hypothetical protein [Desulfatitalea sp.]
MQKTKKSKQDKSEQNAGKLRVPMLDSEAAISAATHLSSEEKEIAIENLKKMPPNNAWYLLNHNPKLVAIIMKWGMGIMELCDDVPGIPGKPGQTMAFEVARFLDSPWLASVMARNAAAAGEVGGFLNSQLGVINHPDSPLWTDEQRLALKFARACLENTMTDELFEQARELWGEQKVMGYIAMLTWDIVFALMVNACGMPPTDAAGAEAVTPEESAIFRKWWTEVLDHTLSFWKSASPFGR